MTEYDTEFDIVVLGMGPGGEDVSGRLAEAGLSVAGVEAGLVGGECAYWACVPSKMMIRASGLLAEGRRISGMAGSADVRPDWAPVARRIRDEATDDWSDKVPAERFESKGGDLVRGHGRITGPREVTVGGRVLRARRGIVIATGTEPAIPPIEGLNGTPYWTNREAVAAEEAPESLIVLGGGSVGSELAQVFSRFGTRVTLVEAADRLLPQEEPEAGRLLADVFTREGIAVRTGTKAERVAHDGGRFTLTLEGGETVRGTRLLVATGRRTDLTAIGAGQAGLDESAEFVEVDERMRAADGVWAVGDVTGRAAFTHVAVYQGRIAARDILGEGGPAADYRAVPRATFTDPEVASVGLSEQQARDEGLQVRVGLAAVDESARGWIHKTGNDGLLKLVEDAGRGVLVGATSAGPAGGEVLGALVVAVHNEVPTARLRHMMYAYPTFHRAIEDALETLE
ncbi:NAD(P)/FAD-dependent oxidoreductase [Planotetraspora sp. A-T 1434]|uniref:dihydrolipoyl dehydrogenase family protein n=1 Tax=Planotetraspora sp. A-T 1434 TaxID=2979219 RepID=UPI0021C23B3C|nr:NAD(P)/FAD-dependent oxidoreductase [Planotetraspora sp. A-T 1434]MCT9930869.1 NAD(P)/FAD-dependent oxidoreductase [Planotetraspora sp. A-T 1434]